MFDIGFSELLVIAVIALIVMGPERLPQALRTFALWFGRIRQQFRAVRSELENEIGIDDVRRQLHNETIMRDLDEAAAEVKNAGQEIEDSVNPSETPNAQQPTGDQTADNRPEKDSEKQAPSGDSKK